MEPKEAVEAARRYFAQLFSEDEPTLEEIWFENDDEVWCVTL